MLISSSKQTDEVLNKQGSRKPVTAWNQKDSEETKYSKRTKDNHAAAAFHKTHHAQECHS